MYCSTCGVAVAQGLSYCNYCGAKLGGTKDDEAYTSAEVKPGLLVSAMVGLFVLGLVAITMLLGMMKAVLRLDTGLILGFALLSFLILIVLEGVILRLLFRRKRSPEETVDTVQLNRHATNDLDASRARALPDPMPSVTEHTTRAFDPIYRERESK